MIYLFMVLAALLWGLCLYGYIKARRDWQKRWNDKEENYD